MKNSISKLVLGAMILCASQITAQENNGDLLERRARLNVRNVTLQNALFELGRRAEISFAYSSHFLSDSSRITCRCTRNTVREVLDRLLEGTNLEYRVTRTQILIVPKRAPGEIGDKDIEGVVLDQNDSVPVSGIEIRMLGTPFGVITRDDGRFAFRNVPRTELAFSVRRVGVATDTVVVRAQNEEWTVYVESRATELEPLVVTADPVADRARFETEVQTSTISFGAGDIARMPGVLEPDVIRTVQSFPGTVQRNDFSTGYNVRGGENDQNLISLDGITVFNPSHAMGIFAAIDPNTIEQANFLTGGFPVQYGGRLSSVLDLEVRQGRKRQLGGRGQVSLLSGKLMLDGSAGSVRWMVGGRRSYIDQAVNLFSSRQLPYAFHDVITKVTVPLGGSGNVAFTAYDSRDGYTHRVRELDTNRVDSSPLDLTLNWGNRLAGVTWRQLLGSVTMTAQASVSEFTSDLGLDPSTAGYENSVRLWAGRTRFAWAPSNRHRFMFGAEVEQFRSAYRISGSSNPDDPTYEDDGKTFGFVPFFEGNYDPLTVSGFIDHQWQVTSAFSIRPGLRLERIEGPDATVLSPRLSLKYFLNPSRAVTVSAGRYHQAVHSLRDRDLPISVYEFWIGADQNVPVARSDQLVVGLEQWIDREYQILIEGYVKNFDGLVIPNRGISLRAEGDEFSPMDGNSWGIDLLVRRHTGSVRGWLGYSFAIANRRADNQEFPAIHDRRHTLNVVVEAPGPMGANFSARWTYGSPLPFTPFVGEWYHRKFSIVGGGWHIGESELLRDYEINSARYPAYSRLDAGLRWRFGQKVIWEPYFQIANAYNKKNILFYAYDYSQYPATRAGISQLPIIPTFGVEFSW